MADPQNTNAERLSADSLSALAAVSRELDTSYRDLQQQVLRLRAELAVSHSARLKDMAEKERLLTRLSSLLAVLPGGVVLLDSANTIRDANPAALALLGQPLLGEAWPSVTQRNPELNGEARGERHLTVNSCALDAFDESVVLITDTSELHDLQEQVGRRHRLAALGEMAARLAHQIRTPLASTTLYLAQLGADDLATADRQRIVSRLGDRMAHMDGLIESMLSFVRGKSPAMEPLYLRDVFDALGPTVSGALPENVTLNITPVDKTLRLNGDADELLGALANLVSNASQLASDAIHIDVWAGATSRDWLQIRVRDDGPGIAEDVLPRIFDPFFTTRAGGTGLGLAVVAMTAANHGGEVRARNLRHGGAEFLLNLPLLPAASQPRRSRRDHADTRTPAPRRPMPAVALEAAL